MVTLAAIRERAARSVAVDHGGPGHDALAKNGHHPARRRAVVGSRKDGPGRRQPVAGLDGNGIVGMLSREDILHYLSVLQDLSGLENRERRARAKPKERRKR